MKKIFVLLFAIIISVYAIPGRNQFKPVAFEFKGENGNYGAIISCKKVNSNGNCIETKISVRTTNDAARYTNTLNLNTVLADGNSVNKVAGVGYGQNKFAIALVDSSNNIVVGTFVVINNVLSFEGRVFSYNSLQGPFDHVDISNTIDETKRFITTLRSSIVNGTSYILLSDGNQVNVQVLPRNIGVCSSNNQNLLFCTTAASDCTNYDAFVFFYDPFFILDAFEILFPSNGICVDASKDQVKFVTDTQLIYSKVFNDDGLVYLIDLAAPSFADKKKSESKPKMIDIDATFVGSDGKIQKIKQATVIEITQDKQRQSVDAIPFSLNTNNTVIDSVTFTVQQGLSPTSVPFVISYVRCPACGYEYNSGNCYIEGFAAEANLDNNAITIPTNDAGRLYYPSVLAGNLGYDRLTLDTVTLLRYSAPCMEIDY